MFRLPRDALPVRETRAGTIVSLIISLISIAAVSVCLSRRVAGVRNWSRLPLVCWLILLIYIDSMAFIMGSAILAHGFGVDSSKATCTQAVVLCLACYMTTKVFIYCFLVERAFIIRRTTKPRMKDKLYLFNSFGMLLPYCVVIALNFYFRFAVYDQNTCRIGMKRVAMIPLIGFDILVNIYLTTLFLIPLRSLYSYKNNRHSQVRTVALRTFIGSCATLISSVVNLTFVMVLNGEPGWICLICCNVDILFSVLVLHWITTKDNASTLIASSGIPGNNAVSIDRNLTPTSPKHLVPRPPLGSRLSDADAYQLGLREYSKRAGVTTMVTSEDKDDEGALERISSLPPGVVNVETEHRLEIEDRIEDHISEEELKSGDEESADMMGGSADLGLWRADSMRGFGS